MMIEGTIILLGIITVIALIGTIGMLRTISRGFKMTEESFKLFNHATLFMHFGVSILAIGHVIRLISTHIIGMWAQGIGVLVFLVGVAKMNKIEASGKEGVLSVDWGELEKEIQATKIKHADDERLNIEKHMGNKSLLLVEVEEMGVLPVFKQITSNIPTKKKVFPMIGVISPYDLKKVWGELGNLGGFWVNSSDVKDEWIKQKFVYAKPSESFQLTNYIKAASKKSGGNCVFVGDFLDEMHSSLNDAQRQQLFSRIKTTLQQTGDILVLILDKGIHEEKELELMERYADGKIEMSPTRTVAYDFQTNERTEL